MKYFPSFLFLLFAIVSVFASHAEGQRRDFVSDEEAELIREHQEIDMRIEVITKFIDRRLAAAGVTGHTWSAPKKNSEKWGAEPKGSRIELLSDVRRLLQKSIDDVDDIASRTSTAIEGNEASGKLFPKAVRNLAAAATRYRPILASELSRSTDQAERGLLQQSIEFCDQIMEAAANLPAEIKEEKKKSKT